MEKDTTTASLTRIRSRDTVLLYVSHPDFMQHCRIDYAFNSRAFLEGADVTYGPDPHARSRP